LPAAKRGLKTALIFFHPLSRLRERGSTSGAPSGPKDSYGGEFVFWILLTEFTYFCPMKVKVDDLEFEKMIPFEAIEERTAAIGKILTDEYKDSVPVFLGVLNGCFVFMADLIKQVPIPCQVAFMKLSSYRGGLQSTRTITEDLDLKIDIAGRDVILVEDIVDTGNTLRYLVDKLNALNPKSIKVCALLYKPDAMEHEIPEMQYVGFEIENKFVVGYGLDYKELGRNLTHQS
jgi:hypoxanthine phosphoribosyltransferase